MGFIKDAWLHNFKNGYNFGDIGASIFGIKRDNSGSSLWQDITGQSNTFAQNSAAANLQEDAQAHQIYMAENAHQMEVQDLKNAGLNPWLSAGGGVSTASSAIAGTQASNVNALASVGTAAAGLGILIKAIKAAMK